MKKLNLLLWITQGVLGFLFVGTALWKFFTPIDQLATMIPWAGQVAPAFLYLTAFFDLAGGLGLILPGLFRIGARPLTLAAALGCAALQASAVVFHLIRGEAANTPFNIVLIALSLFVFWGRRRVSSP